MHEEALHLVIIWCVLHTGGVIRSFLFLAMSVTPLLYRPKLTEFSWLNLHAPD